MGDHKARFVKHRLLAPGLDSEVNHSAVYPTLQNRYTGKCPDAANSRAGRPTARAVLQSVDLHPHRRRPERRHQLFSIRNVR